MTKDRKKHVTEMIRQMAGDRRSPTLLTLRETQWNWPRLAGKRTGKNTFIYCRLEAQIGHSFLEGNLATVIKNMHSLIAAIPS